MKSRHQSIALLVGVLFVFQFFLGALPAFAAGSPSVSTWARMIVPYMDAQHTMYQHGTQTVTWKGVKGATSYAGYADCSGFLLALLGQTYGVTGTDYKQWTGSTRPNAGMIHDYVQKNIRFARIQKLTDTLPGDVIAIKYMDPASNSSGHIAVIDGAPQQITALNPIVPNTKQWSVRIIDSTENPHGAGDSRQSASGSFTGIGTGTMRIYTDLNNTIVGYSWSVSKYSTLFQQQRDLVVGRYR